MKQNIKNFSILLVLLLALVTACDGSGKTESNQEFDPVGDWKYKVTTDVSYGVITIQKEGQGYKASMTTEVFGTLTLMNLKIDGRKLTADLDVAGTPAKITCDFSGNDKMKGSVKTADTEFPFIGDRE